MKCPKRGYENKDGDNYCKACSEVFGKVETARRPMPETNNAGNGVSVWQTVGFGKRFIAYLIDTALLILVGVVLAFGLSSALGNTNRLIAVYVRALRLLIGIMYFVGMWALNEGSTFGKKLVGIKIVTVNGNPIGFKKAMLRYAGYFFSGIVFGLGFFWIIWDKQNQGWHDKIAKTIVVKS